MKKLLVLLVVLILAGGSTAWYLLQPKAAPPPPPLFSSSLDLPILPVPILLEDKVQGSIFLKLALLFNAEEKEQKARRFLPVLFDHFLKEMVEIAPRKAFLNGTIDQGLLETHLQRIADDVLGTEIAIVRVRSMEIQKTPAAATP